MNAEGTHTYKAIFTPKDTINYNVVENIDINVKVVKTDSRQKVNKVTATSNIADIVVLDGAKQFPSFTVTEGSPAYFSPTSGTWVKYNGTEWEEYTASTFTEGKYKLRVQVRIDYPGGDTHVLDKNGVTVTVDGNVWNADAPLVYSNYSYAWLTSGEFVVNKTVTTYTVSFNANGGTGTMANVTVSAGAYTLPVNSFTAPAGKQFKGWATGATGAVIAGTTYHVADNVTFYAIWEGTPHTHNYGTDWHKNSEKHWHECSVCHEKKDEAAHTFAWKVDKQATVTATGAKHEECTVCGYKKNAVVIDKLAPSITEGKDSTWNKNSQNGLVFKSDAAYTDFTQVLVDGEVIAADNYDKREGSIIVELKASYLATLSEGEHTLTIRSKSGDATVKFTVEAAESAKSTAWIWIVLAVVILGGGAAAVYVFVIRKRKTA